MLRNLRKSGTLPSLASKVFRGWIVLEMTSKGGRDCPDRQN